MVIYPLILLLTEILMNSTPITPRRMDKKKLLKDFETEFEKMRKELKFSASLEQLDRVFYLRDYILSAKYLSPNFSKMITRRITDVLNTWNGYLHALIMPNPTNMVNVTESKMFSDEEKEAMIPLMNSICELLSRNNLIALTKDTAEEGKWIDDCLGFWNKILKKEATKIAKKTHSIWVEKVRSKKERNTRWA